MWNKYDIWLWNLINWLYVVLESIELMIKDKDNEVFKRIVIKCKFFGVDIDKIKWL